VAYLKAVLRQVSLDRILFSNGITGMSTKQQRVSGQSKVLTSSDTG
jgi:hypothetical protein